MLYAATQRGGGADSMNARIIDGKAIAAQLRAQVAAQVKSLADTHALVPRLAVVLVGRQAASETYVRSKTKAIVEVGMRTFDHRLPASVSQAELIALVRQLNADPTVHGILVQLPLPPHIDGSTVVAALDPDQALDVLAGEYRAAGDRHPGLCALHAARLHPAGQERACIAPRPRGGGDRPLQCGGEAFGAAAARAECDGDHRAQQDARSAGRVRARRQPVRLPASRRSSSATGSSRAPP